MNVIVELLVTLALTFYYTLEGILLVFIPFSFRRKEVKGQRVLITGAGSGLGRLMSYEFAKLGCTVVCVDVNKAGNDETTQAVKEHGVSAHAYICDISKRDDVYRVMDKIKKDVGDIDILVNNAGIVTGKMIMQCPDELMQKTMDINATAHFWLVKSVLPSMLKRNHGHIVSIASLAGYFGSAGQADYSASKFAAVGFDEALRLELIALGKTGVHTTAICPFFISTGMFEGAKTKFPALMPFLKPEYVVKRIIDGVLCNQAVVIMPRDMNLFIILKAVLPVKAFSTLSNYLGGHSMDEFRGRYKEE